MYSYHDPNSYFTLRDDGGTGDRNAGIEGSTGSAACGPSGGDGDGARE
jgi:hypothetical protein